MTKKNSSGKKITSASNTPPARCAGVLMHISSIPSRFGIGDLGDATRDFVRWMAASGFHVWQILPVVPDGPGHSPYASWTAFGSNIMLTDLQALVRQKLLTQAELAEAPLFRQDVIEFDKVQEFKLTMLKRAANRFLQLRRHPLHKAFQQYGKQNRDWLEDAVLFRILRETMDAPWWEWEPELRDRNPRALAKAAAGLSEEIQREKVLQFFFETQWQELHSLCAENNIRIVGDVPIYVGQDSADVWANRKMFKLDKNGLPLAVAGCPPDDFSQTGQMWGNPIYDWKAHAKDGYRWWIRRLARALKFSDIIRIDHFRGLSAYWEIPAGSKDARPGKWAQGPGQPFMDAMYKAFGTLPLVAEDLGYMDDGVRHLRDDNHLPGMLIMEFAFGGDAGNEHLPHNHERNRYVYPGTHDNETLLGWWRNLSENARVHAMNYLGIPDANERQIVQAMIRQTLASPAFCAIIPAQDLLCLGNEARMNTPGTDGPQNWSWRMTPGSTGRHIAGRLRILLEAFGRA